MTIIPFAKTPPALRAIFAHNAVAMWCHIYRDATRKLAPADELAALYQRWIDALTAAVDAEEAQ